MQKTPHSTADSIVFITGTDTGVGKTVLTALLLHYLRENGVNALAIKPFCSGGQGDAELLLQLQARELTLEQVNPWFVKVPLSPAVAMRKQRNKPNKSAVLSHIQAIKKRCEVLLVEGAGGLMSPLGVNYSAWDLIKVLKCRVLVVATNRLGCLNHIFLSLEALKKAGSKSPKVILMEKKQPDLAAVSNRWYLQKYAGFVKVLGISWLGHGADRAGAVKKNAKKIKKTLAQISGFGKKRAALCKPER